MRVGDRVETKLYLQPNVGLFFGRDERRYVDAGLRGTIRDFGPTGMGDLARVRFDGETRDWIASTMELRLI